MSSAPTATRRSQLDQQGFIAPDDEMRDKTCGIGKYIDGLTRWVTGAASGIIGCDVDEPTLAAAFYRAG